MGRIFTLLALLILVVYYKGAVAFLGAFTNGAVNLGYMLTGRDASGAFKETSIGALAPGQPPIGPPSSGPGVGPMATSMVLYDEPNYQGASYVLSRDLPYVAVGTMFGQGVQNIRSIRVTPPGSCYTLYQGINYSMGSIALCGDCADTWNVIPWHASDPSRTVSSIKL